MSKCNILSIIFLVTCGLQAEDLTYYFGAEVTFKQDVPTPEAALGYQVGDWHVRPDQLVAYMNELAKTSDRVEIETIGYTHESRPLVHLTISHPNRLKNLETHRIEHLKLAGGEGEIDQQPVVIWMGYSVHGNEPSGSNAALLFAYYLAAAEGIDVLLENVIVIFDPSLNPDGLGRFAHWVNSNKGRNLVADGQTREHRENWPGGRTNHYWFDLNRDWLLLVHPESRARVRQFHKWRPNILTDHHEMGTNSTFFFQPGIPSRQNPLTPAKNLELTRLVGGYHAKALDAEGELYFSEQSFDDFYYGKGSTYPDIQGCIGILFEQASSRGHLQNNSYGPLRFADTIKNQLTTSLSTLQAGYENRTTLLGWQRDTAVETAKLAGRDPVKGFVFGEPGDPVRAQKMAEVLHRHQVELYRLAAPFSIGGTTLSEGYVVPTDQPQYRLIKSLFEPMTEFADKTFYDVSTWHFPSAYGVLAGPVSARFGKLKGARYEAFDLVPGQLEASTAVYAYAFSWDHYYAPRAAIKLMESGLKLRFTTRPFTGKNGHVSHELDRGSVLIPLGLQTPDLDKIQDLLRKTAADNGLDILALDTGLTPQGIDLGSGSIMALQIPKVAVLCGRGTSSATAGTLWHLLDVNMDMTVTLLDKAHLERARLSRYTHLVVPDTFGSLTSEESEKLKSWLQGGGTLIAIGSSIPWSISGGLVGGELRSADTEQSEVGTEQGEDPKWLSFEDRATHRALDSISGAAFAADLDLSHPINYGIPRARLALFRTSNLFLEPSKSPYHTPVRYAAEPLISGYVSAENLKQLGHSAAVVVEPVGRGRVILMTDPPNFRGYWLGTNKMFLNGLFFDGAM